MKTLYARLIALALFVFLAAPLYAQENEAQDQQPEVTTAPATIVTVARDAGNFTTLLQLLDAADLTAVLEGDGPFTLYAPTDEAFAKLPEGTLDEWMKPENKDQLAAVLKYHVVADNVAASDAADMETAETLTGQTLNITSQDDNVMVNDATVVTADIDASNGVIHAIDTVLMPPQ